MDHFSIKWSTYEDSPLSQNSQSKTLQRENCIPFTFLKQKNPYSRYWPQTSKGRKYSIRVPISNEDCAKESVITPSEGGPEENGMGSAAGRAESGSIWQLVETDGVPVGEKWQILQIDVSFEWLTYINYCHAAISLTITIGVPFQSSC